MTDQAASPFRAWAIVEVFGHERLAGEVSEQTIGAASFIRVDVPAVDGAPAFTRLYGEKAIYSITPVDEQTARRAAAGMRARPITVYLAPALPPPGPTNPDPEHGGGPLVEYDDDDGDDFDDDDDDDGTEWS